MEKMVIVACLASLGFLPIRALAQDPEATPTPTISDLQAEVQKLQDDLNQLEINTEMSEGKEAKVQSPTFGLAGGSFEQDFESNSDGWGILQGQDVRLKFYANPVDDVTGHLDLEIWGNVASDIFQYDSRQKLVENNDFLAIREFDTSVNIPDLTVAAFKGQGYGGYLQTRDDFFILLPDENDVDKYFRISGVALPVGLRITGNNALDGLEILTGYELQWGSPSELYGMYQHKVGTATFGIIDRLILPYYNDNPTGSAIILPLTATTSYIPTLNTVELTWKQQMGDWTMDAVGIYSPISPSANKNYTYVTQVAPGAGTDNSGYVVNQGTVSNTDALGYQLQISSVNPPLFDSVKINGEYAGLTAGDLERISGELTKVPFSQSVITFDVTYQRPLVGPNPLIYMGNTSNYLGILVQPRGEEDPFQVTSNPISGVNNREMTKLSLSFVYNPGNGWFFKYNPNIFGAYNINTEMDTPFSLGLSGSMVDYPTGTDLYSYVNQAGALTWEGLGMLGQSPTDGFQPYVQGWLMFRTGDVHWIANAEGGFSESGLSWNDVAGGTASGAPSTDLFISSLSARIKNTTLTLGYNQDVWGPEDWDVQFGEVVGRELLAEITQKVGNSVVSLKYEKWSNNPGDDPIYQASIINGVPLATAELYGAVTVNF